MTVTLSKLFSCTSISEARPPPAQISYYALSDLVIAFKVLYLNIILTPVPAVNGNFEVL